MRLGSGRLFDDFPPGSAPLSLVVLSSDTRRPPRGSERVVASIANSAAKLVPFQARKRFGPTQHLY